jgi:sugar lactone lactonase YvrE
MGIAASAAGDLLVSDLESHRIWKVPAAGGQPVKFADVSAPHGMTFDEQGRLWVVSHGADQLLRFSAAGKVEVIVKGRPFKFPHDVVVDKEGQAFVSDGYAKAVWKVPATGGTPAEWVQGKPLVSPVGIAWKTRGTSVLIVDPHAKQLFVAEGGKITAVTPPVAIPVPVAAPTPAATPAKP